MKTLYPPSLRHKSIPDMRPRAERRERPRDVREIWSTAMREDHRMQEFLSGVQVHDIDWQDSESAFQSH